VPFTVVITPDGRLVYQQQGEIDVLELRPRYGQLRKRRRLPGLREYWALKPLQPLQ